MPTNSRIRRAVNNVRQKVNLAKRGLIKNPGQTACLHPAGMVQYQLYDPLMRDTRAATRTLSRRVCLALPIAEDFEVPRAHVLRYAR